MAPKKLAPEGNPAPEVVRADNEHLPLTQITVETQDGGLRRIRRYQAFSVEHEISSPLSDGSPRPPDGTGWMLLRELKQGHSLWRRIRCIDSERGRP
jgi:hypothetical protein